MVSLVFHERLDAAETRIIPLTAEGRLDSSATVKHNIAMRFYAAFSDLPLRHPGGAVLPSGQAVNKRTGICHRPRRGNTIPHMPLSISCLCRAILTGFLCTLV
jgi:hypothetical protein